MNKNDIEKIINELSTSRPIFHGEDDFKMSLADKLFTSFGNDFNVILEEQLAKEIRVDICLENKNDKRNKIAFELKYKTTKIRIIYNERIFNLKKHDAKNFGCYDEIKDIIRLENLKKNGKITQGFSIFLTNANYKEYYLTNSCYKNFSLIHGKNLIGLISCNKENIKTTRDNLELSNSLSINWKRYSSEPSIFEYLMFEV